ncbi:universal stress protein [Flavisolibacter nicotianae]|uniref:universal stress protein n=1 Tax=Flavisolibacter nicotianae TaxID=2364882 RepID=UPI000EB3E3C8|nr:universal stress protein [Flavisolibacter nicotianae]
MKMFIAAFDGLEFSESTLQYAIFLAKWSRAQLVGVFLEDFTRRSYGFKEIAAYEGTDRDHFVRQMDARDSALRKESVALFEKACKEEGVNYDVHRDRNVALQELLEESIYADLLIISAGETMTGEEEPAPTRFIRDLLNDVACPVILVPESFQPLKKLVLLYDGELSSVNAVRSFRYLFDIPDDFATEVVTVKEQDESERLPHNRLIKEFIRRHYPQARYTILKGDAEDAIVRRLQSEHHKPLLILGAYRRSRLSRLFRPSMADQLLENLSMPLFIAPNKA